MKLKNGMINKALLKEIEEYCELNEIDTKKTLNKALRDGFTTFKFGPTPLSAKDQIKTVEVIKTVIKEVPVEVIKEVEVIREVPVDRIIEVEVIKEVSVDKEVIREVPIEKNININVDGHNFTYMEYIDQLNVKVSKLEVDKKKMSKKLLDTNNKSENLEIELSDYKTRLKDCMKKQKTGLDFYGES